MVYEAPRAPRVYDESDLAWIAKLLDVVEESVGEPWRVLIERVEYAPLRVHVSHRAAMLQALRRVLGATLSTMGEPVESRRWTDLAMDRLVELPEGRPRESELAAFANLERIQRCMRRAHALQLRLWDPTSAMVRAVARCGLISQIRRDGEAAVVDVIGPLALVHSTIVYGRALAALVPLLADLPWFALDIDCRSSGEDMRLQVATPVWLPPGGASLRRWPRAASPQ